MVGTSNLGSWKSHWDWWYCKVLAFFPRQLLCLRGEAEKRCAEEWRDFQVVHCNVEMVISRGGDEKDCGSKFWSLQNGATKSGEEKHINFGEFISPAAFLSHHILSACLALHRYSSLGHEIPSVWTISRMGDRSINHSGVHNQWIGLRDNLQESPIFNGKIYGFL